MPLDWTDFLASGQKQPRGNAGNARLAQMLMEQGVDSSPIQSPFQGLARLAQAYVGRGMMQDDLAKQQQGNQAMADILAPPSFTGGNGPQQTAPLTPPQPSQPPVPPPVAPPGGGLPDQTARVAGDVPPSLQFAQPQVNQQNDPRNAQIAQLLNGGVGQDVFAKQALDQLGFGTPKDPLKGAPGDVFFDPKTHQAIPGMSVPNKPDKPEATPDILQIAKELFPDDPAKQHAYVVKNSPANLRAITNISTPKQNWQVLTDPKTNTQYRYDLDSGTALTLDNKPYTPGGAGKIASGQARSAAALAASMFVQQHPDATAQDVTQFAADYGKTVKSNAAFATGKQGDLVRSFNVAVSHLNTLDGLVDALGNGDVQALNKFGNALAQQTGKPAPTNFDAAKAIVGDEIIKAIVGGGGALADRENAQNQISRANSPAQLRGVIKTYKELMAGQLKGLKKQYTDTTGRDDFDKRLSQEAVGELEHPHGSGGGGWSNFKVHN